MGIATAFITALPTIAQMVGANRVVRGVAITNPTGDPTVERADEVLVRRRIVERALEMVSTEVAPRTVWEVVS
jgi:glycine reductase complex component B subunit gamma